VGDIANAIRDAWAEVRPRLDDDPAELRRRLARWPRMLGKHWPREWCFAVRAGDTRIEGMYSVPPGRRPHAITFDARMLVRLCRLVTLTGPGERVRDVAEKLGRTEGDLLDARINGTFATRHYERGEGKGGGPQAVLFTRKELDPSVRGFEAPHPGWGETAVARCPLSRMAECVMQSVKREPHFQGREVYLTEDLHPEHPKVDRAWPKKVKHLPPPEPDYVPYKWKDGVYLGYDWQSKGQKELFERHERQKALARAAKKRRRLEGRIPPRTQGSGSLEFKGWRWVCPLCGKRVQVIYRRAPAVIVTCIGKRFVKLIKRAAEKVELPGGFGCAHCHRIFGRGGPPRDAWNNIICFLTGGLLYGSEVKRPAWWSKERKRAYRPRIGHPGPTRRPMVQKLLLQGLSYKQIAAELGMSFGTVVCHANNIYKQHGVRGIGRIGLANALGVTLPEGTFIRRPRGGRQVLCEKSLLPVPNGREKKVSSNACRVTAGHSR
jgi:hypothetical protein